MGVSNAGRGVGSSIARRTGKFLKGLAARKLQGHDSRVKTSHSGRSPG